MSGGPGGSRRRGVAAAALVVACWAAGTAAASVTVGFNVQSPALKVDAQGEAEVSWTAGGARHTLLVPPHGALLPGGKLKGADVSKAASTPALPDSELLRTTSDGRLWALQAWRVLPGGPVELHLSRWTGDSTSLTLAVDGKRVVGKLSFQGKPVHGRSTTPAGERPKIYVYLDCFGCPIAKTGWGRMLGIAPRADGSFRIYLRPSWKGSKYRATVSGPNLGTTYAPDAEAIATAP